MTKRRTVLKGMGATSVTVGMAGCLSRLPFVGGDEDEEDNEDAGEATDEENSEDGPPDTEDQQDDESDAQERDEDEAEEQEQEQGQERPEGDGQPDEEDYDVDDEDFEGEPAEQRDVEELGADAVTIDASANQDEQGAVTITGSVTNEADQTLTADLDILCYDGSEEYIGATLITVREVPPGESTEFTGQIGPDELQGDLGSIRVEPTVYASG